MMGTIYVSGLADHEVELFEELAEEHDVPTAVFSRRRLRAGYRLWDTANDFNAERLEAVIDDEFDRHHDNTSERSYSEISRAILRNLSSHDPTPLRDTDEEDLVDIMFEELIKQEVSVLQDDDKVKYVPSEGFIKT